jgi:hypothetical protein
MTGILAVPVDAVALLGNFKTGDLEYFAEVLFSRVFLTGLLCFVRAVG